MVKQDYIMRLIHEVVRTLLKLIFNVDQKPEEEIVADDEEISEMYNELLNVLEVDGINHAEDRLYEMLDSGERSAFKVALYFYDHINSFDEDMLEQYNFCREEIKDGLLKAAKMYGYDNIAETLLS